MKLIASSTFLFSVLVAAHAQKARSCVNNKSDRSVVSAKSDENAGLEDTFAAFKSLLGDNDNGSDPATTDGFRSINWDAPIVPFNMPGDFFKNTVTRGLQVSSKSNKFRVSNPTDGSDDRFDSINAKASKSFQTFSPNRLFTPIKENTIEITFSPAGQNGKATVNGFGAMFVDVDKPQTTKMTAYDEDGCIVFSQFVEAKAGGLSFLGVAFGQGNNVIAKVIIKLGNSSIDQTEGNGRSGVRGGKKKRTSKGNRKGKGKGKGKGKESIVVLDDFAYGEPILVR